MAKRKQNQAHLELRPQDYKILYAAASTTMRRMGLSSRHWDIRELINIGWMKTFFYCKSYEHFERYGYLHAIRTMAIYVKAQGVLHNLADEDHQHIESIPAGPYDEPCYPLELIPHLLKRMPRKYRHVIHWKLRGLTFREIGMRMGISLQTVINYYQLGIQHMRGRLDTPEAKKILQGWDSTDVVHSRLDLRTL